MMMQDPDDLLTANYSFLLPEHCIAQNPVVPRDHSRLLVVFPDGHRHCHFYDLPELLEPGDLLVLNDTRVLPARLLAEKPTGGKVEVLLLEPRSATEWLCLVKPGRRLTLGQRLLFGGGLLEAVIVGIDLQTGGRFLQFETDPENFERLLVMLGKMPLPPYLEHSTATAEQYQTIWAAKLGAVAAPTAGLHFTPELLHKLELRGVEKAEITLHVGLGTFRPVQTENILEHHMHREWLEVSEATVEVVRRTRERGGRIFAVGTTSARSLESAGATGELIAGEQRSDLFIYPGYRWQIVQGLITNFHLPCSSLLMLVSSLIGRQRLLKLYDEAIEEGYRFYSFGDGMLILP
jgi:S-adenosylmethionine:tRNA ribosyltransferase-isomerase